MSYSFAPSNARRIRMGMFNRTDLMSCTTQEDILRQKEATSPATPLYLRMNCACFAASLPVYCRLVARELPVVELYHVIILPAGRFGFQSGRNVQPTLYSQGGLERLQYMCNGLPWATLQLD